MNKFMEYVHLDVLKKLLCREEVYIVLAQQFVELLWLMDPFQNQEDALVFQELKDSVHILKELLPMALKLKWDQDHHGDL